MAVATRRILVAFPIPEALRDLLLGIADYAKHNHCAWQILCVDGADFTANFAGHRADGVITVVKPSLHKLIDRLVRSRTPVVNTIHDTHPRIPSVLSDDYAIGEAGAKYFIERGFRSFGFARIRTKWSSQREQGFANAIRKASLPPPASLQPLKVDDFRFTTKVRAHRIFRQWVHGLPRPIAVMAPSDFVARAILNACIDRHLEVPRDLALLGVDNFHTLCELSPVPISSIAQDFHRIGFEAARLLDQRMRKPNAAIADPVLVPPGRLHVRSSTDVLAFEDPIVVQALRFIHDHTPTGLDMKELLRQVPLSRKWLDHRFKQIIGRTPSQEIRRCRLQFVRDLLLESDLTLRQIVHRCQFSCVENLIRSFRAAYGMSPQAFRQAQRDSRSV